MTVPTAGHTTTPMHDPITPGELLTAEQFDALPRGTLVVGPEGNLWRKLDGGAWRDTTEDFLVLTAAEMAEYGNFCLHEGGHEGGAEYGGDTEEDGRTWFGVESVPYYSDPCELELDVCGHCGGYLRPNGVCSTCGM